jgi:4-amino-4-deoxy-L-arabinose transferase-like glycosyltransferase
MTLGHRREAWLIAGLLAVYLVLAAVLPAADDEVYYWSWARPLQFSYYDHPPLTAYMIRVSTAVFGDTIFGFRVPACLATAFVVAVIARLSRPKSLLPGIVLTPLFTLGAVMITPDTPLLCAWAAYVWWLVEVHRRLTPMADEGWAPGAALADGVTQSDGVAHADGVIPTDAAVPFWLWLVGGVILGCGVLGKYTMALAVPAGFASFCLVWRLWRRWLPGYILHGVISFVVASPILIHNIQHDFVPLLFQWRHSMGDSRPGLKPFGEFVGVQLLLFGTLPFFLYPWVVWNFRKLCENPRLRACACLYAFPMTFFLYKATQAPLQGNWALVMFVSFWPLAAVWYESVSRSKSWREWTVASFVIPAASVVTLTIHLLAPLPVIPIEGDRITRQYALNDATRQIAETIRQRGEPLPVFTPTYQITAWLRFQSLDGRQIDQISRPSHFTQHPEHLTDVDRAYVVAEHLLQPDYTAGFAEPQLIGKFPIVVRGEEWRSLQLFLYTKNIPAKGDALASH